MKRLDELLLALAGGEDLDEARRRAGFSDLKEARAALRDLARSLRMQSQARGGLQGGAEPPGLVVYVDGASRGNPGPSSIGAAAFLPSGEEIASVSKAIGRTTNNVAEYTAVLEGLRLARSLGAREAEIRLDSELVVRQLRGEYRIRNDALRVLADRALAEAAREGGLKF